MEMLMLPVTGTLFLLIGELADDIGVSLAQRVMRRAQAPAINCSRVTAIPATPEKAE